MSIHFRLILDCLCHSRRVPMRRIGDGVDNGDIFGENNSGSDISNFSLLHVRRISKVERKLCRIRVNQP